MQGLKSNQSFFPAQRRETWALTASVTLHMLLGAFVLFINDKSMRPATPDMPLGFQVRGANSIEVSILPSSATSTRVRADAAKILVRKKKSALQMPAVPAPPSVGFADGTKSEAPAGNEAGFSASERERYLFELRLLIANRKVYPSLSRRLGETGRVVVQFQVHRSGTILDASLKSPSSHERLNQAALNLVSGIRQYRPFPEGDSTESLSVEVPIDYLLN